MGNLDALAIYESAKSGGKYAKIPPHRKRISRRKTKTGTKGTYKAKKQKGPGGIGIV